MATCILKRAIETVLCGTGSTRIARALRRHNAVVLAYHNIVPDGTNRFGDRSLHLSRRDFVAQLDFLQRAYEVVSLEQVFRGSGAWCKPRVAISFDDAYAGAVEVGIGELTRRGLPATIFVAPAHLGGRSFWWDVIAGPEGSGLSADIRRFALDELCGVDVAVRDWARQQGIPLIEPPAHARTATVAQLQALTSTTAHVTLAAHSWSHPNLARIAPSRLEEELLRPLAWLRDRFEHDRIERWLTYPYGSHSPTVEFGAARAGYYAALRVDGGLISPEDLAQHRFRLPRLNVPAGISVRGLEIRMAGLLRR